MKQILLWIIRGYRSWISPLKGQGTCRFYPTCSMYAYTAISRFGAIKGGWLAIVRICKCHPFHEGGVDYVPEEFSLGIFKGRNNNKCS